MSGQGNSGKIFVSLDGCGTLGYTQVLILSSIMHQVQRIEGLKEVPRVVDRIELIGGTGMGGIIALFLGRLRMGVIQTIIEYQWFSSRINGCQNTSFKKIEYNSKMFDEAFREIACRAGYDADDPLEEEDGGCKTVVFALNARNTEIQAIRSYKIRSEPNLPFTILQAARATMASPDLFSSIHVGNELYGSELVGYFNNPVKLVLKEAGVLFSSTDKVAGIVSVGVGKRKIVGLPQNPQPGDRVTILKKIAEDCERAHQEMATRYSKSGAYHRMNVEQGLQDIEDESEKLQSIERLTFNYLKGEVKQLRNVARTFVRRTGGPLLGDLNYVPPPMTIFPPPPVLSYNFVGRSDLIAKLVAHHFTPLDRSDTHWISLLWGVAGIGKTQASIKLWMEFRSRKPNAVIFFLDARSQTNLENDLRTLIQSRDPRFWSKTHHDALKWLATTEQKWVIILDNADDPDMDLSKYIPMGSGNHLVITSRNPDLRILAPNSNHQVRSLESSESIQLLLSVSQSDDTKLNQSHAKDIVVELQYHSLAIAQAGVYILKHGGLATYLSIFRQHRDRILLDRKIKLPNYEHSVYATLQLSFEKLPNPTKDIIQMFSFLNNGRIDEEIITQAAANSFVQVDKDSLIDALPFQREEIKKGVEYLSKLLLYNGRWDQYNFNELISPALQSSLLLYTEAEDHQKYYSMHALVQSFLRFRSLSSEVDIQALTFRIIASNIDLDRSMAASVHHQRLFPHIRALKSYDSIIPVDLYFIGRILNAQGEFDVAERVLTSALGRMSSEGVTSRNKLMIRTQLRISIVWMNQGKHAAAADLGEKLVQTCSEIYGEEHPDTMLSIQWLAFNLSHQGQYSRAAEMQNRTVEIRRKMLGEEHHQTLESVNDFALSLQMNREYARSIQVCSRLLEVKNRTLGEDHVSTILTMGTYAISLSGQGLYSDAINLYKQVAKKYHEAHGEGGNDTQRALSFLGEALSCQGNHSEAVDIQVKSLRVIKKQYGKEHPTIARVLRHLGSAFSRQANYSQAAKVHSQDVKFRKKKYGDEDVSTLSSIANLGRTISDLGHHSKAKQILTKVLETCRSILGEEHPDTLAAMNEFGVVLSRNGDYLTAIQIQAQVLEIRSRIWGEGHQDTLTSMYDLAVTFACQARYAESSQLFDQVVDIRTKMIGPDHYETLRSKGWLSRVSEVLEEVS